MPHTAATLGPQRIVCLTEETTEWLYLLGEEARIVGISGYTVRPRRAREEKPKVSAFLSAKIDKILALQPDCVFGFSDLQADIAAAADPPGRAGDGLQPAQRGRDLLHAVPGGGDGGRRPTRACSCWTACARGCDAIEAAARALPRRPRVFFEEWDEPHDQRDPLGVGAGRHRRRRRLLSRAGAASAGQGPHRRRPGARSCGAIPDIVIGSWCGKKFRPEKVAARAGWGERGRGAATAQLFEIKSADILQPGPAALTDGVEQLHRIVHGVERGRMRERWLRAGPTCGRCLPGVLRGASHWPRLAFAAQALRSAPTTAAQPSTLAQPPQRIVTLLPSLTEFGLRARRLRPAGRASTTIPTGRPGARAAPRRRRWRTRGIEAIVALQARPGAGADFLAGAARGWKRWA